MLEGEIKVYKVYCGKGVKYKKKKTITYNCAICKNYTGKGSGGIICKLEYGRCKYSFSFINWCKAIFK